MLNVEEAFRAFEEAAVRAGFTKVDWPCAAATNMGVKVMLNVHRQYAGPGEPIYWENEKYDFHLVSCESGKWIALIPDRLGPLHKNVRSRNEIGYIGLGAACATYPGNDSTMTPLKAILFLMYTSLTEVKQAELDTMNALNDMILALK